MGIVSIQHGEDGVLRFENRLCVPNIEGLKKILVDAHGATYRVHPNNTKMYKDLKETYQQCNMNKYAAEFVA